MPRDPSSLANPRWYGYSQGNISGQDLTFEDGAWTWSGTHARATGVLSDDGQTMPTLHEWSCNGMDWRPSKGVTLRKVVQ